MILPNLTLCIFTRGRVGVGAVRKRCNGAAHKQSINDTPRVHVDRLMLRIVYVCARVQVHEHVYYVTVVCNATP
jgi:hypothetical protein